MLRGVHISIRTALSVGVVAAVLLTAALIHIPWLLTSRADALALNAQLNGQVIEGIDSSVDGLLKSAVGVRNALTQDLSEGVIDPDDAKTRNPLFLSFLLNQPGLTSIELARPDNRSFVVRRGTDATIRVEETRPSADAMARRMDVFREDADGTLALVEHKSGPTAYRPTEQFWYFTAFDRDMPVWSNIYRLPLLDRLGVTTTKAVMRGDTLVGVLGVTISLDELSGFLDAIHVTPHSAVFLTNTFDELVAIQRTMAGPAMPAEGPQTIAKLESVPLHPVRMVVGGLQKSGLKLAELHRQTQLTFRDPASGETYFITLAPLPQMGLIACVVIPESDIFAGIDRNMRTLLLALSGFVVVIVIAATLLSRRLIGTPLARVTASLGELEHLRPDRIVPVASRLSEVRQLSAATTRMGASLASFRKYIPTELVRTLFAQGIEAELGGERRELTILFMDLANFTQIAEQLGDDVIGFLGEYLDEMSIVIQAAGGTIDKYIGDGIMAFWGAPLPVDAPALRACRAALACRARLAELRAGRPAAGMPALRARIGLNTGRVLVGNVGSRDRLNYTAIGDPVNVASRLEALNKTYGTEIIIGQPTYEAVRDAVVVRPLDRVAVYGRETGLETFELLGLAGDVPAQDLAWLRAYEDARGAMRARDWDRAIELFACVIAARGGDPVSDVQIARARGYKAKPPPPDWDGLVIMETK
jgi:adenylate cyclase